MPNLVENPSKPEVAPQPPSRAPRRGPALKVVGLLLVLVAAAAGAWAYFHYRDQVSTDDATVDGHISAVAPKVGGNVVEVLVNDNQQVKAGQVLLRIDPRDYQAKVDQMRAALLEAESKLKSAQVTVPWTSATTQSGTSVASAGLTGVEADAERARISYEQAAGSDLQVARANVASRKANNDRAQADLARMKPLVDKAEISRQQYDSYVAAARVAESDLEGAQEKLGSAEKETGIRKAMLDAAQSRIQQAKAQVESSQANGKQVVIQQANVGTASAAVEAARTNLAAAELQLSYATITAPMDGVVTRKSVEVGQVVAPGQGLMTIIPLEKVWVTANFKETQLAEVHPGQHVEIHVDMYSAKIPGHIDSISGATGSKMSLLPPENATGNFVKVVQRIPVKILIDNLEGLTLRPGMNVDVTIFTK